MKILEFRPQSQNQTPVERSFDPTTIPMPGISRTTDFADETIFTTTEKLGILALQHEEFESAESLFSEAVQIAKDKELSPEQIGHAFASLAWVQEEADKVDEAIESYLDAIKAFDEAKGAHSHLMAAIAGNNLALIYSHNGMHDAAETHLISAISHLQHIFGESKRVQRTLIQLYTNLGAVYLDWETSSPAKAKEAACEMMRRAVEKAESKLDQGDPLLGVVQIRMATASHQAQDFETARRYYMGTLKFIAFNKIEDPELVVQILNNLALANMQLGYFNRAESCLVAALERYGNTAKRSTTSAILYNNLGCIYLEEGYPVHAHEMHQLALKLRTSELEEGHELIAQSRVHLSRAMRAMGRFDEAKALQALASESIPAASAAGNFEVTFDDISFEGYAGRIDPGE